MNIKHNNSIVPPAALPRGIRFAAQAPMRRIRPMAGGAVAALTMLIVSAHAFAQTASTAGIGTQLQAMSQEGSTTAGWLGSTAMYGAAMICMLGGAWALWSSRQPQNRESGHLSKGIAGLVLAGLFATGGVWINKAANSASGGNAVASSTAGTVTFGGG